MISLDTAPRTSAAKLPEQAQWRRLSGLLDELLDLAPPARAARLAALRASDAALALELHKLLGAAANADAALFLGGCAGRGEGLATLAGRRLGPYAIEAPLGQGASGSVWRARCTLGRFGGPVAIKLLHLPRVGPEGAARFAAERAILARLAHPNIAALLDAGVTADGQPYLALELVQGEPIDDYCDALQLDIDQRLQVFMAVLDAVSHAHSQRVVHRDIKPSNILVTVDGQVKLLDFGIALLLEDGSGVPSAAGQRALTPQYAAPEQVLGQPMTTATDVYALGVLLYRLLSGRHPTATGALSSSQMLQHTLETAPMPLSWALRAAPREGEDGAAIVAFKRCADVPGLQRRLRGELQKIVARALKKNPAERYATPAALADDLCRHLATEAGARTAGLTRRSARACPPGLVRRPPPRVTAYRLSP